MQSKWVSIEIFCLTVEHGSFTAAAKVLGVAPQTASRAVARLEEDLSVQLFRRNTRRVEATDAGREYYNTCRSALDALESVESRLSGLPEGIHGEVRISVPTTYGHHRFLPMLPEFHTTYPGVLVDVEIDNRNVDFVRDRVDLAIRMGELNDASFVARRLGDFALGIFASPLYLAQHGEPKTLDDLDKHACIVFVAPRTGRVMPWSLGTEPSSWVPRAAFRVRHDVLGLTSIARRGGGLVQMYDFIVEQELKRGELVEILTAYRGRSRPFSLIYPPEATRRAATRALIDFIVDRASIEHK